MLDDRHALDDLEARVRDRATATLELVLETTALVERLRQHYDELEQLADHLYAEGQDRDVLLGLERNL